MAYGASPRLRGKHPDTLRRDRALRCIPAPAGETVSSSGSSSVTSVHPRACGGNSAGSSAGVNGRGASPRLRGKPAARIRPASALRCIPAPAGETPSRPPRPCEAGVHPRACGGNETTGLRQFRDDGASPRLRGKLVSTVHGTEMGGCIPAPAGETTPCKFPFRYNGCIPAPAGETPGRRDSASGIPVHPRACGGNSMFARRPAEANGASPRLRGKRDDPFDQRPAEGCIPAPAGETRLPVRRLDQPEVHPRACGGNWMPHQRWKDTKGASPRLRGKPRVRPSAAA